MLKTHPCRCAENPALPMFSARPSPISMRASSQIACPLKLACAARCAENPTPADVFCTSVLEHMPFVPRAGINREPCSLELLSSFDAKNRSIAPSTNRLCNLLWTVQHKFQERTIRTAQASKSPQHALGLSLLSKRPQNQRAQAPHNIPEGPNIPKPQPTWSSVAPGGGTLLGQRVCRSRIRMLGL